MDDILREDDDNIAHGVSSCSYNCGIPPEGAMFPTLCGIVARVNPKGEPCRECVDVMGGKTKVSKLVRACWRCGKKPLK